jgi:hypothetical protein
VEVCRVVFVILLAYAQIRYSCFVWNNNPSINFPGRIGLLRLLGWLGAACVGLRHGRGLRSLHSCYIGLAEAARLRTGAVSELLEPR